MFATAPKRLQALTKQEGDNLWIVRIPVGVEYVMPPRWFVTPVEEYVLKNGDRVLIGRVE